MVCAFMLLVFQWEFGAASTPSRTGIKEKECIDLMLGNQAADWVTGVPGDCLCSSEAVIKMAIRDSSRSPTPGRQSQNPGERRSLPKGSVMKQIDGKLGKKSLANVSLCLI